MRSHEIGRDDFGRVLQLSQGPIRLVPKEVAYAEDETARTDAADETEDSVGYIAEVVDGRCNAVAFGTVRRQVEAEKDGNCIVEVVGLAHYIGEVVEFVHCVAAVVEYSCCIAAVADAGSCIVEAVAAKYYYS